MIIVIFGFLIVWCFICFIIGIVKYFKLPKPPDNLTFREYRNYYNNLGSLHDDENDELNDIHKQERILLLDETIIKYNRLLDSLNDQYKNTWSESEKDKILTKQIATMEKLNRALEKREKLE